MLVKQHYKPPPLGGGFFGFAVLQEREDLRSQISITNF